MKNKTVVLIAIIVLTAVVICSCSKNDDIPVNSTDTSAVELTEVAEIDKNTFSRDKIERICNLSSLKCEIHLAAEGKKENTILWIFHDNYDFIFEYDGFYEVGVTIGDITVDEENKTVTVEMSDANLLNCDINEDSLKKYRTIIYDKDNILMDTTELTIEEATKSKGQAQERLREYVETTRPNYDVAEKNAKKLIEDYISVISSEMYKVNFKKI